MSVARAGKGTYNQYQAIPGGFTRPSSVFANLLQENIRSGFPSKNFTRMTNAKTRETMLQLHRDMSMATTGLGDTAASFYRTTVASPKDRPQTAHLRATSEVRSTKTASAALSAA